RALIDHLVGARLLVSKSDDAGSGATVELVHESLIGAWPQLKMWAEAGKEEAAFLVQLRQVAQQWESRGRAQGLLWRGEAADEARRFATRLGGTVAAREQDYLSSVIALANKSGRVKRLAVAMTMLVLAALAITAVIVVVIVRDAEQKAILKADEAEAAKAQEAAQVQELKDAQAKRDEAEKAAEESAAKEAAANKDTQQSRAELQKTNVKLQAALEAANRAIADEKALREKLQGINEEQKRQMVLLKQHSKGMATTLK
ncbi:MAG TPA: AAA family ATPase, partial [Kofleriaceae bacterium]|nr:AAA family ATPase [Kofleriaceae bacterium]